MTPDGFDVLRRVYVDFEGINFKRKFLTGLEPDVINILIGEPLALLYTMLLTLPGPTLPDLSFVSQAPSESTPWAPCLISQTVRVGSSPLAISEHSRAGGGRRTPGLDVVSGFL